MSAEVENRVVRMEFDNEKFEKNVQDSLKTIDKLKKSLDFKETSKGLKEFQKSAEEIDLSKLADDVDTIANRMTALGQISARIWQRMTDEVLRFGTNMTRALTIQPAKDGFDEYELKMKAVQVIMSSTGESVETVNAFLDDLNTYADKTIYSFKDMTDNIGKFTNAGVKLSDAVITMKGLSNEAALVGANTEQASRSMYNLSQAMSMGYMQYRDWRTMENTGMATPEFKKQLLETAEALGTVVKKGEQYITTTTNAKGKTSALFDAINGFQDSMSYRWMTTDVLVETFKRYGDETTKIGKKAWKAATEVKTFTQMLDTLKEAAGTGWATTWEQIIGNKDEATEVWTAVSNVLSDLLGKFHDVRNAAFMTWKQLKEGGRSDFLKGFGNIYKSIKSIAGPIRDAFRQVFPYLTSDTLAKATTAFKNFTQSLILTKEQSAKLKIAATGLLAPLNTLKVLVSDAFHVVGALVKAISPLGNTFLDIGAAVGNAIINIEWFIRIIRETIIFTLEYFDVLNRFPQFVKGVISGISSLASNAIGIVTKALGTLWNLLGIAADPVSTFVGVLVTAIEFVAGLFLTVFGPAIEFAINGIKALNKNIQNLNEGTAVAKKITSGFNSVKNVFKQIGRVTLPVLDGILSIFVALGSTIINTAKNGLLDFGQALTRIILDIPEFDIRKFIDVFKEGLNEGLGFFDAFLKGIGVFSKELETKLAGIRENLRLSNIFNGWLQSMENIATGIDAFLNDVEIQGWAQATANALFTVTGVMSGVASGIAKLILDFKNGNVKITSLFSNVIGLFTNLVRTITDTTGKVNILEKAFTLLTTPLNFLKALVKDIFKLLEPVIEKFAGVDITEKGEETVSTLERISRAISDFMSNITPANVAMVGFIGFTIAMSAALVTLVGSMSYATLQIGRFFGGLSDAGVGITRFFDSLTTLVNPIMKGKMLITQLALAISTLTVSIKVLSEIPQEDIERSITTLIGALIAFDMAIVMIDKLNVDKSALKVGRAMASMSTALLILTGALFVLEHVNMTDMLDKLMALGGAVAIFTAMAITLSKFEVAFAGGVAEIVGLAGAIFVLSKTLESLGNINIEHPIKSFLMLLPLLSELIVVANMTAITTFSSGMGLVAIAVALNLAIGPFQKLAQTDFSPILQALRKYKDVVFMCTGITAALMILSRALSIGMVADNAVGFTSFAKAMISIAGAMILFATAINMLSKIDGHKIKRAIPAIVAIGSIMAALEVLSLFTANANFKGLATTFLGVAVAIDALIVAIYVLGSMDKTVLVRGTATVGALIVLFGSFMTLSKLAKGKTSRHDFAAILATAVSIALLGGELYLIGKLDWEHIHKGLLAIGGSMVALMVVLKTIQSMPKKISKSAVGQLALALGALAGMGFIISRLAKIPWDGLLAASGAMILAVGSLAGVMAAIVLIGNAASNAIGMISTVVLAMAALWTLSEMLISMGSSGYADAMLTSAEALLMGVVGMGALMGVAIAVGAFAAAAIKGLMLIGTVAAVLAAVIAVIGAIDEATNGKVTAIAEAAGDVIGKFVGGIVDGFRDASTENLSEIGTRLGEFADNAASFFDKLGKLSKDGNALSGLDVLNEFLGGISDFMTKLTTFKQLNGDTSVDSKMFKPMVDGMNAVIDMLPKMNRTVKALGSTKDGFSSEQFDERIRQIKQIAKVVKAFGEAANEIPNEGLSVASFLSGDNDLEGFANDIGRVGLVVGKLFSDSDPANNFYSLKDVDITQLDKLKVIGKAVKALAQAAQEIPNEGLSFSSIIVGDNRLRDFATQFGSLVKPISNLAGIIKVDKGASGVTPKQIEGISKIAKVIKALADAADTIRGYNLANVQEGIAFLNNGGENTLSSFAKSLSLAIPDIKQFMEDAKDLNGITTNTGVLNSFVDFVNKLGNTSTSVSDGALFVTLGKNLEKLGKHFKTMSTNMTQANSQGISSFMSKLEGLSKYVKSFKGANFDAIELFMDKAQSLADTSMSGIIESTNDTINQATTILKGSYKSFMTAGERITERIAMGMKSVNAQKKITTAVGKVADRVKTEAGSEGNKSKAEAAGKYLLDGLIVGLGNSEKLAEVKAKATAAGKKAVEGINEGAEVNSPSKATIETGKFIDEGLGIGIQKGLADVSKISEESGSIVITSMAKGAKKGTKSTTNVFSGALNSITSGLKGAVTKGKKTMNKVLGGKGFSLDGFTGELKKRWEGVKKLGNFNTKDFLKEAQDTVKNFQKGLDLGGLGDNPLKGLEDAVDKAAKDGSKKGTSKGVADGVKGASKYISNKDWSKLFAGAQIALNGLTTKYDPFNSKSLKKTDVWKDTKRIAKDQKELKGTYVAASVKNKQLRTILTSMSDYTNKIINKEIEERVRKSGKKISEKTIKRIVRNYIDSVKASDKDLKRALKNANFSDKVIKHLLSVPKAHQAYIKAHKQSVDYAKGATKFLNDATKGFRKSYQSMQKEVVDGYNKTIDKIDKRIKDVKGRLKNAKKGSKQATKLQDTLDRLETKRDKVRKKRNKASRNRTLYSRGSEIIEAYGEQLYKNSDAYKTTVKNIKDYEKQRTKLEDKIAKIEAKRKKKGNISKEDANAYNDLIKQVKELDKQLEKEAKQLATGGQKAWKNFRNGLRDTYKEYTKLANIQLPESIFQDMDFYTDQLGRTKDASSTFSKATSMTLKSTNDIKSTIDMLNVSLETGINLLEQYQKAGRFKPSTLLRRARKQLEAYDAFQNGLQELQNMGLADSMIEDLRSQGPSALNYVRSFLRMSKSEVDQYNEYIRQESEYASQKALEDGKKQLNDYKNWLTNLKTLKERLSSTKLYELVANNGVSGANLVTALLGLSDSDLKDFEDTYTESISDTLLKTTNELVTTTATEVGETAAKTVKTFREALEEKEKEDTEWNTILNNLRSKGYTNDVISYFAELGSESGKEWAKTLLDETEDGIAYINKTLEKSKPSLALAAENINKQVADYDEYKKAYDEVEQKKEHYAKVSARIDNGMYDDMSSSWKKNAKEMDKQYSYVADHITDLGYTQAEGVKALANATVEEVKQMYAALENQTRVTNDNSWKTIKKQTDEKGKNLKEFEELYTWLTNNANDFSVKGNAKTNQKGRDELLKQIREMGIDDGIAYMRSLKYAAENDPSGYKEWQHDFYLNTFKIPDDVADAVAADTAAAGVGAVDAWAKATDEAVKKSTKSVAKAVGEVWSSPEVVTNAKASGLAAGQAVGDGVHESKEYDKKQARIISKAIKNTVDGQLNETDAKDQGKKYAKNVSKGMTATNVLEYVKDKGKTVGTNICDGMAEGIREHKGRVKDAAVDVAEAAYRAAKRSLDINSPSKKFIFIGSSVDEGWAKGIHDMGYLVSNAANDIGIELTDDVQNAMKKVSDVATMDDIQPKIEPVMNLDELNDIKMPKMVADFDMTEAANKLLDTANILDSSKNITVKLDKDTNSDVVKAISDMNGSLSSDISNLAKDVAQMQLVMDTGTLVGAIINPIDREMGRRATMAERRII